LELAGSRRSGGFGISTPDLLAAASRSMAGGQLTVLGYSTFGQDRSIQLPNQIAAKPDHRLSVVRGSGAGWASRPWCPIYEEALGRASSLSVAFILFGLVLAF
jgi:hypothetical protein